MRLYESPINQDEMIKDAYPHKVKPEAGALVLEARYYEKQIDEDDPHSLQVVCDIVDHFDLQPYHLTKAAFVAWARKFMPARKAQLESTNPANVEQFMADAKKYVNYVTSHFGDFEFYLGNSGDPEDYIFAATQDGDTTVFYLLELACNNVKC
jgi:hypothetical protein